MVLLVNCWQIKPQQAQRLCEAIRPSLAYVVRLRRRMEQLGFPPDDVLYRAAARAHDAMQELHVRAHYCACPLRTSRPRENRSRR